MYCIFSNNYYALVSLKSYFYHISKKLFEIEKYKIIQFYGKVQLIKIIKVQQKLEKQLLKQITHNYSEL